ncbi:hypothetical protein BDD12DRAFT_865140 [Trichophaea hybrida]|nr:hypothetical protein BDD12DRAFT_865140 [Trichophaea hybrida]
MIQYARVVIFHVIPLVAKCATDSYDRSTMSEINHHRQSSNSHTTAEHKYHIRSREPRCDQCSIDRKKCTVDPEAPVQSSCHRCLGQQRLCLSETSSKPREKLNHKLCEECRKRKQACIFNDGAWPKKCWQCKVHNLQCSQPRQTDRRESKRKADDEPLSSQAPTKPQLSSIQPTLGSNLVLRGSRGSEMLPPPNRHAPTYYKTQSSHPQVSSHRRSRQIAKSRYPYTHIQSFPERPIPTYPGQQDMISTTEELH